MGEAFPAPVCQVERPIDLDPGTMCLASSPTPGPTCGSQAEIRGALCWTSADPLAAKNAPPPAPTVQLDPQRDFEEGSVAGSLNDARKNPMWVENEILNYQMSRQEPWTFSILYNDATTLVLPLTAMFFDGMKSPAGTLSFCRRHKHSGRIIPFKVLQSDPGLRDPALRGMPIEKAITKIGKPRFDSELTPTLLAYVNQEQAIFMATGFLKVIELQLMNPLAMGWSAGAKVSSETGSLLGRLRLSRAARVVVRDAETVAEKIFLEANAGTAREIQKYLEFARRLSSTTGLSPADKAALLQRYAQRFGLEVGGLAPKGGGRFILVAKDAKSAFEIAADGTIRFGRFSLETLDIANGLPIRPLQP